MKTIRMHRDHNYRARRHVFLLYRAGHIYERVPEMAARSILAAAAGEIIEHVASSSRMPQAVSEGQRQ